MPDTLVSDNRTQFKSFEFGNFCLQNGIKQLFTAPYHPQSHGQAERFVDTLKRALLKMDAEGKMEDTLQLFLLNYRSTPNNNVPDGKSPAEAMFGRNIRTTLDLLRPPPITAKKELDQGNKRMALQFNRHHGAKRITYLPTIPYSFVFTIITKPIGNLD